MQKGTLAILCIILLMIAACKKKEDEQEVFFRKTPPAITSITQVENGIKISWNALPEFSMFVLHRC